ncbi:MAG: hypothetical protein GWN00_24830, partial [Aliifodinibius sp.]|nr:hypothetical protein [Fodinibius sp.]NIV14091.1 hypothetical protein [Fodinibius sp.]NIY27911.1 hypothetical protein [Fodinibius sp.]
MGGGGADVEYSQSPEQREVYRALQPMVQRLGGTYGGVQQPVQTQIGPGLPAGSLQLTPRELNKWMQYGGQTSGGMPVGSVPYEFG